jgi:hypothetical protein
MLKSFLSSLEQEKHSNKNKNDHKSKGIQDKTEKKLGKEKDIVPHSNNEVSNNNNKNDGKGGDAQKMEFPPSGSMLEEKKRRGKERGERRER